MAEPLKNRFGPEIPHKIATMIEAVFSAFPKSAFMADALAGLDPLELMDRGRHLARALQRHLPADPARAMEILVLSLGPPLDATENNGMAPFLYLPHALFVAEFGLDHLEASLQAQHALTQRFTAEFSIRPFLQHYPQETLERLRLWAADPSPHVRRLVSEGTRPRLPWAPRLPQFQADPAPVLALLELLKDDPSEYVRRSVANNLNDIGKDHPELLLQTARRWLADAPEPRRQLVRHALRTALKRGDAGALAALGLGGGDEFSVEEAAISPRLCCEGGRVAFEFVLANTASTARAVRADLRVHFVRSSGVTSPKVYRLREFELGAGERVRLAKTLSVAPMTTRRHYPGKHRAEAMINGRAVALGFFEMYPGLATDPRLPLIAESYARLTGRSLAADAGDLAAALWTAPRVIVAHGTQADPVFFYGNRLALKAFEMDFAAFTRLPSRFSAEPLAREERARLLERVSRDGFIDDYAGIRISRTGRRFRIEQATVWNLMDAEGRCHGQAATFESWSPVEG